jgi:hypothetical protein
MRHQECGSTSISIKSGLSPAGHRMDNLHFLIKKQEGQVTHLLYTTLIFGEP